jgi:hypothetical protein
MSGAATEREEVMVLHQRIQYLRKEHEELEHLLDTLHEFLEMTGSENFEQRAKGLSELRAMDHHLTAILEHCHSEDRAVQSLYDRYVQDAERARINREHRELILLVERFRDELKFATVDHTITLTLWGKELVNRMHSHTAYEDILLNRIDALSALPDEVVARYIHSAAAGNSARAN